MLISPLIPLVNLPTSLTGWVGMILMFSVAVAIHELGHLMWAKWFGVGCEEFAIGFGKRLIAREWRGTIYSIRALPLGGFVKIKGMVAALEEEREEEERREAVARQGMTKEFVRSAVYESSLAMKDLALWKRLLVFSGGVINNVILGVLLFTLVAMTYGLRVPPPVPPVVGWVGADSPAAAAGFQRGDTVVAVEGQPVESFEDFAALIAQAGRPVQVEVQRAGQHHTLTWEDPPRTEEEWLTQLLDTTPPLIAGLFPNSPAERAGLRVEDLITAIAGIPVTHWMDLQAPLEAASGEPVEVQVLRGGEAFTVTLTAEFKDYVTERGRWTLGFQPGFPVEEGTEVRLNLGEALAFSAGRVLLFAELTYSFLWKMLTLQLSLQEVGDNVGGPVQIFVMSYQSSTAGLEEFLWFAGLLNVLLAIMNILPIPILDGGHCIINIIESLRRRPIPLPVLERVYALFFALIIALMVTVFAKDIIANWWRLTGSGS
ncbi:MAG: RIP metalloprotease RseP [Candidatus Sumerlaeia bacterium]|nr:RIP metalloprotease RseP [Candidatus Sumerlaeia bacterium]